MLRDSSIQFVPSQCKNILAVAVAVKFPANVKLLPSVSVGPAAKIRVIFRSFHEGLMLVIPVVPAMMKLSPTWGSVKVAAVENVKLVRSKQLGARTSAKADV